MKSAGRRRFFGSKQNSQEHASQEEGHRSTTKVLRSLFFHNSNQVSDNDGSIVPPEPHLSLTSQTSHTTNESGVRLERTGDLGSESMERTVLTSTTERTVVLPSAIPGIPGLQDNTSPDSGIEDNIGCVMRGCSDAELLGTPFTTVLYQIFLHKHNEFCNIFFSVQLIILSLFNVYLYN